LRRVKRRPLATVELGSESAIRVAVAGEFVDVRVYRRPGRRSPHQGPGLRVEHVPALIETLQAAAEMAEANG
jgi:hypothetical protein